MDFKYSVLMSVYVQEKPEYLYASIKSMLSQTLVTDDFVLVCDGPLTDGLNRVIWHYQALHPELFQIIRLPENIGIGAAANTGLSFCRNELVAKMDSDDIAVPERCEMQLAYFRRDNQLDIVGGQIEEFHGEVQNIVSKRRVPLAHQDVLNYAKRRSPFNNQTIMYKKSSVLAVGGYSSLRRCEDYDLFIRMLLNGCKSTNCGDVLVYYRMTEDTFKKRGSLENLKCFFFIHRMAYTKGFCSFWDFLIPCAGQTLLSIMPVCARKCLYRSILRRIEPL